jgi:hypothetical protein
MQTTWNSDSELLGRCRVCREWKRIAGVGGSQHARNEIGDQSWYWDNSRGEYKSMCKTCEREYKRARRAELAGQGTGRAFGVELELTGPSDELVIQALVAHGVPMAQRNLTTMSATSYRATNTTGRQWELKRDSSVAGHGLELVSPLLRGQAGYDMIEKVAAALRECGATVNRTCGLHVHHDFRNLSLDEARRQVLAFVERENLILQLVAPSRRTNSYCSAWQPFQIDSLRQVSNLGQLGYVGPRGSINCHAYARHGSVEIRAHGGTTNARKILAWVRFGQALFAAADAGATIASDSAERMLADLMDHGLTAADAATLLRFQRVGETRSEIEATIREANELLEEVAS